MTVSEILMTHTRDAGAVVPNDTFEVVVILYELETRRLGA